MVVKHIQIYDVYISLKCICKPKKIKVDLFTTSDKSFFGSHNHPLEETNYSLPAAKAVD